MVLSPISNEPSVFLFDIPSHVIVNQYREEFGIDVSDWFKGTGQVSVYQCPVTFYRHYSPAHLAGDGKFYEQLQKYPWYYSDWKWDYDQAAACVAPGDKVLDIGCGSGKFLRYLTRERHCTCTGLELNENAVAEAVAEGLDVRQEFVQTHAEAPENRYDVVCAFQVLEHIADAGAFLEAAIRCLKPGGKLIICVPNNNPWFYQHDRLHTLNLPPHHMNLWDSEALTRLATYYGFSAVEIREEAVSCYRRYARVKLQNSPNSLAKALFPLAYPFLSLHTFLNRKTIKAGSVLAVYSGLGQ